MTLLPGVNNQEAAWLEYQVIMGHRLDLENLSQRERDLFKAVFQDGFSLASRSDENTQIAQRVRSWYEKYQRRFYRLEQPPLSEFERGLLPVLALLATGKDDPDDA